MNAFHVFGSLLALWALTLTVLGLRTENFPATDRAMRVVGAVSVTLVALAIGTAIYTGATEKKNENKGEHSALPVLPV